MLVEFKIFKNLFNLLTEKKKFFDFHNGLLVNKLQLPANINQQLLQRENGLMALNCGDNILRVVDIESLRIVREFKGFTKKITDMVCIQFLHFISQIVQFEYRHFHPTLSGLLLVHTIILFVRLTSQLEHLLMHSV